MKNVIDVSGVIGIQTGWQDAYRRHVATGDIIRLHDKNLTEAGVGIVWLGSLPEELGGPIGFYVEWISRSPGWEILPRDLASTIAIGRCCVIGAIPSDFDQGCLVRRILSNDRKITKEDIVRLSSGSGDSLPTIVEVRTREKCSGQYVRYAHLFGYAYCVPDDTVNPWRIVEYTWCEKELGRVLQVGLDEFESESAPECKQYIRDCDFDAVSEYYLTGCAPVRRISSKEFNEKIPDGEYVVFG